MALGDLKRGMALAVFGEFDEDGKVLHAQRIVRLPVSRDADAPAD